MTRRLSLLLTCLSFIDGNVVNFEDAQRLKEAGADCRMQNMESWNGGQYDLGRLHEEWQYRNHTGTLNVPPPSSGSTGKRHGARQHTQQQDSNFPSQSQQQGFNSTAQSQREKQLKQELDQCHLNDLIKTRQVARRQQTQQVDLRTTWERYWHQLQSQWYTLKQANEQQQWAGWQRSIQNGDSTEYMRQFASQLSNRGFSGFGRLEGSSGIKRFGRVRGFGFERIKGFGGFSELVDQALTTNNFDSALGQAFSLQYNSGVNTSSEWYKDLYVLVAQQLHPLDFYDQLEAGIYGSTITHFGRDFTYDGFGYIPGSQYRTKLGRAIDQLLCRYARRRPSHSSLTAFHRRLLRWIRHDRFKGRPRPIPPNQMIICQSHSTSTRWKRNQLCSLRSNAMLSAIEYEHISHMIDVFEGRHPWHPTRKPLSMTWLKRWPRFHHKRLPQLHLPWHHRFRRIRSLIQMKNNKPWHHQFQRIKPLTLVKNRPWHHRDQDSKSNTPRKTNSKDKSKKHQSPRPNPKYRPRKYLLAPPPPSPPSSSAEEEWEYDDYDYYYIPHPPLYAPYFPQVMPTPPPVPVPVPVPVPMPVTVPAPAPVPIPGYYPEPAPDVKATIPDMIHGLHSMLSFS